MPERTGGLPRRDLPALQTAVLFGWDCAARNHETIHRGAGRGFVFVRACVCVHELMCLKKRWRPPRLLLTVSCARVCAPSLPAKMPFVLFASLVIEYRDQIPTFICDQRYRSFITSPFFLSLDNTLDAPPPSLTPPPPPARLKDCGDRNRASTGGRGSRRPKARGGGGGVGGRALDRNRCGKEASGGGGRDSDGGNGSGNKGGQFSYALYSGF